MTATRTPLGWRDRFRRPALAAYVVVLLIATLTPFEADPAPERVAERATRAFHPTIAGRDVIDGARNIVLFAGWGVVWSLTAAGGVRRIVLRATGTGAALSALVETAQLFSSNRTTSFLDLATNTGGAFAGAVVLIALVALGSERRGARSFVGIPALFFAGSYCTASFLEAVIPLFRQDSVLGATGGPFRRFATTAAAFQLDSFFDLTLSDIFIFLPAGCFAVAALAEHGMSYPLAFRRVAIVGVALAILAELLHGFLGQPMLVGAALIHALAIVFGAWLAARALPRITVALRGKARPQALAGFYALVLAAWAWRPFLPEVTWVAIAGKFAGPWYVPLAALGGRVDFFSVVDVCAPFFLYLPLGGLLAVWPLRRDGWLAGPLPGIWCALAFEVGQTLVWERTLDVTDVLVQASGVVIGWAIAQRAGYRVYGELMPKRQR
jgi:VanZ family protein